MTIQPTAQLAFLRLQLLHFQREIRSLETALHAAEDDSEYLEIVGEIFVTGLEIRALEGDIAELRYRLVSDIPPLRVRMPCIYNGHGELSKDTNGQDSSPEMDLWG